MPKISVLTTFFNSEQTIGNAIESILNQSFQDFELILVDDASTVSISKLIKDFDDHRIRLFSPGKLGRAAALNFGLNKSKGEYIAVLDSDDIAFSDRLEKQYNLIKKKSICLVASNAVLSDDQGNYIGETNFPSSHEAITESLFNLNPFPHSSVMLRKSSITGINGYNERCEKSIDLNMYLDLLKKNNEFYVMKESLINLNISSTSWGVSDNKSLQLFFGLFGVLSFINMSRGGVDYMRGSKNDFILIKDILEEWFYDSSLYKRTLAKRYFRDCREALRKKEYVVMFTLLYKSFKQDFLFFTYRGIKFNPLKDVNKFIDFSVKNYPQTKEILINESTSS